MATPPPASFVPPSEEMPYYDHLFATADTAKTGQINGRDAVSFLSRSKLPLDLLKNIWNIADQNPKTSQLDKKKFFVAVRLIQLFQNGLKVNGSDLSILPDPNVVLRPPFFEGVTNGATPPPTTPIVERPVLQPNQSTATSYSQQPQQLQQQQQKQQQQPDPNMALATQDPYGMTPSDRLRYEKLFPEYANEDGFVYGKEAVALFTKSGLDMGLLRNLWNMVDYPVDNRLSKLEFAISMHLIVCISKKNLPMPSVFPPSLKALKDQEIAGAGNGTGVGVGVGPTDALPSSGLGGSFSGGGIPSPTSPERPKNDYQMNPSSPTQLSMNGMTGQNTAPPPPSTVPPLRGGMAISDAFSSVKDLDSNANGNDMTPTTTHYKQPQQWDNNDRMSMLGIAQPQLPQLNTVVETPVPLNTSGVAPSSSISSPPSIQAVYSKGDTSVVSTEELKNLQSVLQKLQAENVSLKAQLGQFSDEETSVRKEIANTVSEISSLSMVLTSLRSQVTDAQSSLIEATAELKAQIEKRE